MAVRRVVLEHAHREIQLVDAVHTRATAAERDVARACTRLDSGASLRLFDKMTAVALQPVADNSIETKIRNKHECAVGIGDDHVRMRPLLAGRIRTAALVPHDMRRLAKRTVVLDGQGRDGPAGVVGHQYPSTGWIDTDVSGVCSTRSHTVEQPEPTASWLHRKRADPAILGQLVYRVQEMSARRQGEVGRIVHIANGLDMLECATAQLRPVDVDALGLPVAGVRAHPDANGLA